MNTGRRTRRVLAAIMLSVAAFVSIAGGMGPGSAPASAAVKSSMSSGQPARPQTYVVKVYFRSIAERDELAGDFGAEELATTQGYLTFWADQATYNEFLRRGLRVEIDPAATARANDPNLFSNGRDSADP